MEEKKLDRNSIVGFIIIAGLLIWLMLNNMNKEQDAMKQDAELAQKELVKENQTKSIEQALGTIQANDSLASEALRAALGSFAYSAMLPSAQDETTELKSDLLTLHVANKGGYLSNVTVNDFERFSKNSGQLVELIKDHNSSLNLELYTNDNRVFNTSDLYFEPELSKEGENQVLSMRLKASETQYLEYRYVLKPNNYMLDFSIRSVGLNKIVDLNKAPKVDWWLKGYRNEKSISYENRYTNLYYEYENGKDNDLGAGGSREDKTVKDVSYIAFKQHFFTSILLTDKNFADAKVSFINLASDESDDAQFTKEFNAEFPLAYSNGELNYDMNFYFGPSDYKILSSYDRNLDEIMPLGWGIFGWLNRFLFIPIFGFLTSFIPSYGVAIIVLTIIVRLLISPLTYKSYVSQAKMKAIRPEITELNEKFKNDPMKKQQETMNLYSKAGVNPMAGCIPAVLQIPIFYSLFQFFPSVFALRQKSFLWADDLSSYDSVISLPFTIPFYGNHISLFPILASIAIFIYMKMTTGDQQMSAPQQEGMPDMGKLMKIMIYISPVMMLFFFNNYASGLSLYYFVSNSITIGIMYVIKNHIVKEDKIKAIIEENKTKKRPKGRFQRKMQEMMEQAQEQQRLKEQGKK
ncbi:membrane protein insertase YidC [Myroides sp. LJL116]